MGMLVCGRLPDSIAPGPMDYASPGSGVIDVSDTKSTTPIKQWTNDIHQGDAVAVLNQMPEDSVHTGITSPPYFGLRDYAEDGQIGLEESLDEFIEALVEVGEALRRVLRDDGSWWLNLGDTFASKPGWGDQSGDVGGHDAAVDHGREEFPRKSKMLVPHRVAIALQDAGWIIRADAVWAKPNPMPHPVKDRLNETKEFVFHLVPETDYWFDLDPIREPHQTDDPRVQDGERWESDCEKEKSGQQRSFASVHPNGKNPGDILEVATKPYPEAHFAVYPEELCEPPIKASCPPRVCKVCGTPYERETIETPLWERDIADVDRRQAKIALKRFESSDLTVEHLEAVRAVGFGDGDHGDASQGSMDRVSDHHQELAETAKNVLGGYFREFAASPKREDAGWAQACDCPVVGDYTEPGIVLDPFAGSGTTALVAKQLGRRFIGIDLNPEYVAMAQKRVGITVDEPERLLEEGETNLRAFADGGVPTDD